MAPRPTKRPIRLAMIATYPKMSKIFMSIAEEANIQAYNIDASFENAVRFAKEIEPKVDAILSRRHGQLYPGGGGHPCGLYPHHAL